MAEIIDITVSISANMVTWPGDSPVEIDPVGRIANGASCNTSLYKFGSHVGTHVDPPFHFVENGETVDNLDLDALIGPAWVAYFPDRKAISADDLEAAGIPDVERLLLKTDNATFWPSANGNFRKNFVHLTADGANWVVGRGIRLIGIDYLSIEKYRSFLPKTHLNLLSQDVIILEGTDLSKVEPGGYQLICLPLKVAGGDGAPTRAVLIKE